MKENLYISPGPHIFSKYSTPKIMKDVLIALIPAILASIYFFRMKAVILLITSLASCVLIEAVIQRFMKRKKGGV